MRVAICVCTCKRPQLLTACLDALANQVVPDGAEKALIVIDNEESPNNKEIVARFGAHYVHEPRRGISYARNRALQEAVSISSDWVAFVDDDQEPLRDWLSSLIQAQAEHNADVVQSRLIFRFPERPTFWSTRRGCDPIDERCGWKAQKGAATGGVMFRTRYARAYRFDNNFALIGGEDGDFFSQVHTEGAKIIYSERPRIVENVHFSRLTYLARVRQGLSSGAKLHATEQKRSRFPTLTTLTKANVRLLKGLGQILIAPALLWNMHRFKFTALEGGRNIAIATGAALALISIRYEFYKQIHGQ
jgi:succinoglycan biosynthesis protein ExoM